MWWLLILAADGGRLDDVGIDGALGKPAGTFHASGFRFEHVDEGLADGFALGFRFREAREGRQETLAGIDARDVEAHAAVGFEDFRKLVAAQQAIVHKDAVEPFADGFVEQDSGDGGVDAAAQAEDDLVAADLTVERIDGGVDERGGGPVAAAAADGLDEIGEDPRAVFGMVDFRMELHGIGLLAVDAIGSVDDAPG